MKKETFGFDQNTYTTNHLVAIERVSCKAFDRNALHKILILLLLVSMLVVVNNIYVLWLEWKYFISEI